MSVYQQVIYSPEQYRELFLKLLPIGNLWTRQIEDTTSDIYQLSDAYSEEFARIDERIRTLINEANPITCVETIDDWERNYGLAVPSAPTLVRRKINILLKIFGSLTSTEPFIRFLAEQVYGYEIVIRREADLKIWTFGSGRFEEKLYDLNYNHYLIFELYGATTPDAEFEEVVREIVLGHLTIKFDWKLPAIYDATYDFNLE